MVKRSALLLCGLALMGQNVQADGTALIDKQPIKLFAAESKKLLNGEVADDILRLLQIWTIDSNNEQVIQGINGLAGANKALCLLSRVLPKGVTGPIKGIDDGKQGENIALDTIYRLQGAFTMLSDMQITKNAKKLATMNNVVPQNEKIMMTIPGALGILCGPISETLGHKGKKELSYLVAYASLFLKGLQRHMIWKKQQEQLALIKEVEADKNQAVVIS